MNKQIMQQKAIMAFMFAKVDVVAMAIAMAAIFAVGLFFATAILLLQSAPEGVPVGFHLANLKDYLPGYSVTWPGAVIGSFYGLIIGSVFGLAVSIIWNLTHFLSIGALLLRSSLMVD